MFITIDLDFSYSLLKPNFQFRFFSITSRSEATNDVVRIGSMSCVLLSELCVRCHVLRLVQLI